VQCGEVWVSLTKATRIFFVRAGRDSLNISGLNIEVGGDPGKGEFVFLKVKGDLLIGETRQKAKRGIQEFPDIYLEPGERLVLNLEQDEDETRPGSAYGVYYTYYLRPSNV